MTPEQQAIRAMEAAIRELRFHQDKPRPERVRAAVRGVLGAVADLPAELMFEGDGE